MTGTLGMLHFGDQLSTAVRREENAHNLLSVRDSVEKLYRWKHVVLIELEDVINKTFGLEIFLNTEEQWVPSAIVMSKSKGEMKIL